MRVMLIPFFAIAFKGPGEEAEIETLKP